MRWISDIKSAGSRPIVELKMYFCVIGKGPNAISIVAEIYITEAFALFIISAVFCSICISPYF